MAGYAPFLEVMPLYVPHSNDVTKTLLSPTVTTEIVYLCLSLQRVYEVYALLARVMYLFLSIWIRAN